MSLPVLLFLCLTMSCTLTTAQAQCGETRCGTPRNNDSWVSNITFTRMVTSTQLDWLPDINLNNGAPYRLVWRNASADDNFTISQAPLHPVTGVTLTNLLPGTRYEALVCLPRFNISTDIPPPPLEPLIPECGFCLVCLQTIDLSLEFEAVSVSQLNETHVNLTCQVEANVDFSVVWSVSVDPESEEAQRMDLVDGDIIGDGLVSIQADLKIQEEGTEFLITSVLIAPEVILAMDVQCTAETPFGSENRTLNGEDINVAEPVPVPVWAISLIVVLPILIVVSLVILLAIFCRRQKKISKEVIELRQLKSNVYVPAIRKPSKETDSRPEDIASLKGIIPEEMIIDGTLLEVSTVIGQGEFGVVYKGILRRGSDSKLVAVKSLKGIFISESDVQSALKEITKMKNFDHPNVMTLVGVCKATAMSGGAPSIVMPYMARGSLLNYLRNERESLIPGADVDITQTGAVQKLLMQICLQISKGMAYLASLRFVHRDLAARNCMIDEKGIIKVADFGLAEDIYMRNYFRQSSQDTAVKLPLKWMAPESIKLGIFSEKSDVWSYGVTCWEVFTAGEIPYSGVHPREVVQLLEDGDHLTRPKNRALSDTMYGLLRSCWSYRSEDRPAFEELASSLDRELTTLADYIDLSMFAGESNVNTASEE